MVQEKIQFPDLYFANFDLFQIFQKLIRNERLTENDSQILENICPEDINRSKLTTTAFMEAISKWVLLKSCRTEIMILLDEIFSIIPMKLFSIFPSFVI